MSSGKRYCLRCGKRLKKGGVAYNLRAELISTFDGYISVGEKTDIQELLDKLKGSLEGLSAEELEEQVYKKHEYQVCGDCRDEIDRFLTVERPS